MKNFIVKLMLTSLQERSYLNFLHFSSNIFKKFGVFLLESRNSIMVSLIQEMLKILNMYVKKLYININF